MIYLDETHLEHIVVRVIGPNLVRDRGLLSSAIARPAATAFGADAYPRLVDKAAALLHSIAMNHALIDGNKRLALAATIVFLGVNGRRLTLTNDEAYDLIIAVASGQLREVTVIADVLEAGTTELPPPRTISSDG